MPRRRQTTVRDGTGHLFIAAAVCFVVVFGTFDARMTHLGGWALNWAAILTAGSALAWYKRHRYAYAAFGVLAGDWMYSLAWRWFGTSETGAMFTILTVAVACFWAMVLVPRNRRESQPAASQQQAVVVVPSWHAARARYRAIVRPVIRQAGSRLRQLGTSRRAAAGTGPPEAIEPSRVMTPAHDSRKAGPA